MKYSFTTSLQHTDFMNYQVGHFHNFTIGVNFLHEYEKEFEVCVIIFLCSIQFIIKKNFTQFKEVGNQITEQFSIQDVERQHSSLVATSLSFFVVFLVESFETVYYRFELDA